MPQPRNRQCRLFFDEADDELRSDMERAGIDDAKAFVLAYGARGVNGCSQIRWAVIAESESRYNELIGRADREGSLPQEIPWGIVAEARGRPASNQDMDSHGEAATRAPIRLSWSGTLSRDVHVLMLGGGHSDRATVTGPRLRSLIVQSHDANPDATNREITALSITASPILVPCDERA